MILAVLILTLLLPAPSKLAAQIRCDPHRGTVRHTIAITPDGAWNEVGSGSQDGARAGGSFSR